MILRVGSLSTLIAVLPLAVASAQSGTVRYDQATRFDFQLPPEMARDPQFVANLPKVAVRAMQLSYTPEATLFGKASAGTNPKGGSTAADGKADAVEGRIIGGSAGGDAGMAREKVAEKMMMGFMGGGVADAVGGAFTNLGDGSYVEVREFLGRSFRIPLDRPTFAWKLTGEAAQYLGYPVYQAIAKKDSTTIEAWFTPSIPVSAGPAQYGGLPGLILTLAVDSNRVIYTATAIDTTSALAKVSAPSDGSKVTRAEYDKIVAEKTEEMRKARRGRKDKD